MFCHLYIVRIDLEFSLLWRILCKKLSDKELDLRDIPSHLQDGIVFFCLCKIEWIHLTGTNMFLSNNSCSKQINISHSQSEQDWRGVLLQVQWHYNYCIFSHCSTVISGNCCTNVIWNHCWLMRIYNNNNNGIDINSWHNNNNRNKKNDNEQY